MMKLKELLILMMILKKRQMRKSIHNNIRLNLYMMITEENIITKIRPIIRIINIKMDIFIDEIIKKVIMVKDIKRKDLMIIIDHLIDIKNNNIIMSNK